ncbi:MAG: MFS transporter [Beijerinckiaceae bacterium]|nr:MAG: MFS transporter [Beijerinckiaceae bacterium]
MDDMRGTVNNENPLPSSAGQQLIAFVALWLCGASLRMTILVIPPILPLLHTDLHLSESEIGLLSSLPTLLFSIAAVPGALLIARFGIRSTLILGLVLTAFAGAARGAIVNAGYLYAMTVVMGAGVSIMQPALPPLVRTWFPRRVGLATAVYTNGLLLGEMFAAALTIPLVLPLVSNSWRLSMVAWSIPVFLTILLVVFGAPRIAEDRKKKTVSSADWWPDWRQPLVWRLGLLFGSVNAIYFVANAFLPDYLTAAGRGDLISIALTSINVAQVPASLLMLVFAGRLVSRPSAYVALGMLNFVSIIGILCTKGVWVVIFTGVLGFANAIIMILGLALPSVLSAPHDVHRTAAAMFTISYSLAMLLSVFTGFLWDSTHLPITAFLPIAVCALLVPLVAPSVVKPMPEAGKGVASF